MKLKALVVCLTLSISTQLSADDSDEWRETLQLMLDIQEPPTSQSDALFQRAFTTCVVQHAHNRMKSSLTSTQVSKETLQGLTLMYFTSILESDAFDEIMRIVVTPGSMGYSFEKKVRIYNRRCLEELRGIDPY